MNFKIEKNIPIPKRKYNTKGNSTGATPIYPFNDMLDGDSFFVPATKESRVNIANSLKMSAKSRNAKVTVRFVEGGVRVWKIGMITNSKGELKQ